MPIDISDELVQAEFSQPRHVDFNEEVGKKTKLYKTWANLDCGQSITQFGRTFKRGNVKGDFTDKVEEELILRKCCSKSICRKAGEKKKAEEKKKGKRKVGEDGGGLPPPKKNKANVQKAKRNTDPEGSVKKGMIHLMHICYTLI